MFIRSRTIGLEHGHEGNLLHFGYTPLRGLDNQFRNADQWLFGLLLNEREQLFLSWGYLHPSSLELSVP